MNISAVSASNSNMNNSKSNVNFGMKVVPETKFLENLLNSRKIPSMPNANGANLIPQTVAKIDGFVKKLNDGDLLDKTLELKFAKNGYDIGKAIPDYKNQEAQLRFKNLDGKLSMTLSSEPHSTNGLPSNSGKKIAECYAPQNFKQSGATATVIVEDLGTQWPKVLHEKTDSVAKALSQLVRSFSDNTVSNYERQVSLNIK